MENDPWSSERDAGGWRGEPRFVSHIEFSINHADDVRRRSVVCVTETQMYENGEPKPKGLLDLKMGPYDKKHNCASCYQDVVGCPGHPGHIELFEPCYHPGYMVYIVKILKCVCFACSKLLVPPKKAELLARSCRYRSAMLGRFAEYCGKRSTRCPHCFTTQPRWSLSDDIWLFMSWPGIPSLGGGDGSKVKAEPEFIARPRFVRNILAHIDAKDSELLGLGRNRPESLVLTVLVVPPPNLRPPIVSESARGSDGITKKLIDIVFHNEQLRSYGNTWTEAERFTEIQQVQYHVATLMNDGACGANKATAANPRAHQAAQQTYKTRTDSKTGRVRGNLMGKRTDNAARGVISPDPNLSLGEVGVPIDAAKKLVFAELVTPLNLVRLSDLCERGPFQYPGAVFVDRVDTGYRIDLRFRRKDAPLVLKVGDKVLRHVVDNDMTLFNRQPSLHRMSMMGHKARTHRGKTFAENLSVTTPYNSDFDGDEMNLHVCVEPRAQVEAALLMPVANNIASPATNKPCMAFKMDEMLSPALMSRNGVWLDRARVQLLLSTLDHANLPEKLRDPAHPQQILVPDPAIVHPRVLYSGKQVLSWLIPPGIDMERGDLYILDGNIISGELTSKTLGNVQDGLVHVCFLDHGGKRCEKMIHDVQKVVNLWLTWRSFSIGLTDCAADGETRRLVRGIIERARAEVARLSEDHAALLNKMQDMAGQSTNWFQTRKAEMNRVYEQNVNSVLNKARQDAGEVAKQRLPSDNSLRTIIDIGSKGNLLNLAQIVGCVGQQNVSGKRVPLAFGDRACVWAPPDSTDPAHRGMVEHSYYDGLTPSEMLAHTQGGREGIVDTAVKTSETGYFQRRLIKCAEDLTVAWDGTVRNSAGQIVQFLYGEDGYDGCFCVMQDVTHADGSAEDWARMHHWIKPDPIDDPALVEERARLDDAWTNLRAFRVATGQDVVAMGASVKRFVDGARWRAAWRGAEDSPEERQEAVAIATLVSEACASFRATRLARRSWRDADATRLLSYHVTALLSSKRCLREYRIDRAQVAGVLTRVHKALRRAWVAPGESVGIIMAQSIGEPSTQMTLNTFHLAGMTNKNVCVGVPRLLELTKASESTQAPTNLAPLVLQNPDQNDDAVPLYARSIVDTLQCRTLDHVVLHCVVVEDPNPFDDSVKVKDRDTLAFYCDNQWPVDEMGNPCKERAFRHSIRMIVSVEKLAAMDMDIMGLAARIKEWILHKTEVSPAFHVHVIEFPDLGNVIRITLQHPSSERERKRASKKKDKEKSGGDAPVSDNKRKKEKELTDKLRTALLQKCILRGIPGIQQASAVKRRVTIVDPGSGRIALRERWHIETDGINLAQLLQHDKIVPRFADTNHPVEALRVFGITAARIALIREIRRVLTHDGGYTNIRHPTLLADLMTRSGFIMPMNRFGINRDGTSVIKRATFEQTTKELTRGAVHNERDSMTGPSESVLVGRPGTYGTGAVGLVFDAERAKELIEELYEQEQPQETAPSLSLQPASNQTQAVAPQASSISIGSLVLSANQLEELQKALSAISGATADEQEEETTARDKTNDPGQDAVIALDEDLPSMRFVPFARHAM